MALFVLLGALFWVQELCLGLVILFQCLFLFCWVLGPSCPLWFSFPPQPSLWPGFKRGKVRVGRGGGVEKGSLAGEVGGDFFFSFVLVLFLHFCLFLFCCWNVFGVVVVVFIFQGLFFCVFFCFFCLFVLECFCCLSVFLLCLFGFAFVLFFVLLEWSRCCSCFEPIPLEKQHQQKKTF